MLGGDAHAGAGARVAPDPGVAMLDREGAEPAQLDAIAARQRLGDLVEDRGDDDLDIPLVGMRIGRGKPLDEFGLGHRSAGAKGQYASLPKPPAGVKPRRRPHTPPPRPAQPLSPLSWRRARLIAAPRMSPRLAPESEEPNSAIARFSSSISRALIDRMTLRVARSIAVILASTFSPTAKRSGRCSLRSRDSSDLRMKPGTPSIRVTSMPPSVMPETVQVTTSPFLSFAIAASNGSAASCLMPSEMRSFSTSTSRTLTRTTWPLR